MLSARTVAVRILSDIERNLGYSNIAIDSALNDAKLSKQDSALVSMLVYGVLQRKVTLDIVLENVSGKGFKKTHPYVLNVLRVGAYQLLFTDKIPASAVVNEAVKTVKSSKQKFASGFVNAVLRKVDSEKEMIKTSLETSKDICFKYSCTKELSDILIADYGFETTEKFLKSSLEVPKLFCRENLYCENKFTSESLTQKGIEVESNNIDGCFSLKGAGNIENLPEFKKGTFFVQDLASQIAIASLDIKAGMSVLDVCAAPGGKSFTAAQYVGKNGKVVSCDLYEKRAGLIQNGAGRLNIGVLSAIQNDAAVFNPSLGAFDRVICDVPCSGVGVIRRKPEIKYKSVADFKQLPEIQLSILKTSARYLKQDGVLMYSTCTLLKSENRCVVDAFLSENQDFEIVAERTLMPHLDGCDGFYYCVLKRNSCG